MGYSITQEKYEKLEANRRAGRLCATSSGRGGCFASATWTETHESWTYRIGEGEMHVSEMVHCAKHRMGVGFEGVNFRVIASERLPRLNKGGAR